MERLNVINLEKSWSFDIKMYESILKPAPHE